MVRSYHAPGQKHSENRLSGAPGMWAMPRSAEGMMDEDCQRVDVHAHAGTAHGGFSQKRLKEGPCGGVPRVPGMSPLAEARSE